MKAHVHLKGPASIVDYKAIQTHPQTLERYTASLSAVSREQYRAFSKNEKLAFLINAYNAFTVTLVVDHYDDELDSIKDIWFGNEWKRRFFMLLGAKRSLDDVEHELIRENGAFTTFAEPRIHFLRELCVDELPRPLERALSGVQAGRAARAYGQNVPERSSPQLF